MRLQGVNVKGVSLYPNAEKELQPATHKFGSVATWSHCTDTYGALVSRHGVDAEINAFKYNLGLTAFVSIYTDSNDVGSILDAKKTGRLEFGTYFFSHRWKNPITGNLEGIPDYFSSTWSQEAYDADLITQDMIGTSKSGRYPSIGKQMFDLTNGKYGYDDAAGVMGSVDVVTPSANDQYDWFYNLFGFYPSSAAFSYGVSTIQNFLKRYFVGIRNSAYDTSSYSYNLSREQAKSLETTTRQNDMPGTRTEVHQECQNALIDTIAANGWYRDFTHWHNTSDTELEDYYRTQREGMGANDVATVGFGTAYEYNFLRDMVRRVGLFTRGSEIVLIADIKDNADLPLITIETPLSVQVDLAGTILEGKDIEGVGDKGIIKKEANTFIVEMPYNKRDGFVTVRLKESLSPAYMDFNLPAIQSVTVNDDIMTATTDKETNAVLFSVPQGGQLYQAQIVSRSSSMNTSHEIDVSGVDLTNTDLYIGVITKERQSILHLV